MTYTPKLTDCPRCSKPKAPLATVCRDCYREAQRTGKKDTRALQAWAAQNPLKDGDAALKAKIAERCWDAVAHKFAANWAIRVIESECLRGEWFRGESWIDLASLPEEFKAEVSYAEAHNLLRHHPTQPNLVQAIEE